MKDEGAWLRYSILSLHQELVISPELVITGSDPQSSAPVALGPGSSPG